MRLLLPAASLLCCLPVLAQSRGEDPADLRAEIRRIVREEVRAALKDALGSSNAKSDSRSESAQSGSGNSDQPVRLRRVESKDDDGHAGRVVRKIELGHIKELGELGDLGQFEVALESTDLQPQVFHFEPSGDESKTFAIGFDDFGATPKPLTSARAFKLDGGKLVPLPEGHYRVETSTKKSSKNSKEAKGNKDAKGSDDKPAKKNASEKTGSRTLVVKGEGEGEDCVLQIECDNGTCTVTCNGEECPAIPLTGGTCILNVKCENGQCTVEKQTGSSCCTEASECCEGESGECCQEESKEGAATAKTKTVEVKVAPAKARQPKKAKGTVDLEAKQLR